MGDRDAHPCQTSVMEINRTQFNRDFIVIHFPNPDNHKCRQIININKMEEIIDNDKVFQAKVNQILNMEGDKITVRLRRGVSFKIWVR